MGRKEQKGLASDLPTLERLYCLYASELRKLFARRIHSRELIEDIVQDTFVQVMRHLHTLDPERDEWPWLFTIAIHTASNTLKKQRRRVEVEGTQTVTDHVSGPEEQLVARERTREIFEKLKLAERRAAFLRHYLGWSYEQIARFEGVTVASVRNTLLRARATAKVWRERLRSALLWPLAKLHRRTYQDVRPISEAFVLGAGLSAVTLFPPISRKWKNVVGMFAAGALALGADISDRVPLPAAPVEPVRLARTTVAQLTTLHESPLAGNRQVEIVVSTGEIASGVPEASAGVSAGAETEDRPTLERKVWSKTPKEVPLNREGETTVIIYCDSGSRVAETVCGAVDELPDSAQGTGTQTESPPPLGVPG